MLELQFSTTSVYLSLFSLLLIIIIIILICTQLIMYVFFHYLLLVVRTLETLFRFPQSFYRERNLTGQRGRKRER